MTTTKGDHGTVTGIQLHRARNEDLCAACAIRLKELQSEGFRTAVRRSGDDTFDVLLRLPESTYWALAEVAADMNVDAPDLALGIVLLALNPARGQARKLPTKTDLKIRHMLTAKMTDSAIARALKISRKTVSDRRERWGLDSNYYADTSKKGQNDGRK